MIRPFRILLAVFIAVPLFRAAAAEPAAYRAPALSEEGAWTMVVIPDPQTYIKLTRNQGIYDLMCAWIAENIRPLNIQQVLVTGDLVGYNGIEIHRPGINDQTGEEQWQAFSRIMADRLDGKIPYIFCTGNHDYGIISAENRHTGLNRYFTPERNPAGKSHLIECGPNSFGEKTLENAAFEFTAPNGRKVLIISLAFAPTEPELNWAKEVAARPEYRNHFGVLLTHAYIGKDGRHLRPEGYEVCKAGGNSGQDIWEKLVRPAGNLRFVVCGHIAVPDDWAGGVAFSVAENADGREVYQMAFNTQAIGGGWHGSGGDGWLRLLEFSPDLKTVKATTFSPLFAVSPATRHLAWRREPLNQFTFHIRD